MQFDRFTLKSQAALQDAQRVAQGYSHQELNGEHLMLALLQQSDSLIPELLQKIGVNLTKLRTAIEAELDRRHKVQGTSSSDRYVGSALKKCLDAAETEAAKLKD